LSSRAALPEKKFSQQVYDMGIKVAAVSLLCAAFGCPEPEQFFGL